MTDLALAPTPDARAAARTHMFIAAAMTADGSSAPATIRDMSPQGALLEMAGAPAAGTAVRLSRGCLTVGGTVVWSAGKRSGVRLASPVNVRDWMAPPGNVGQAEVDAMVARVRAGTKSASPKVDRAALTPQQSLVARLATLRTLIEDLADGLTADPVTISRHGVDLQKIDRALQLITAIQSERPLPAQ